MPIARSWIPPIALCLLAWAMTDAAEAQQTAESDTEAEATEELLTSEELEELLAPVALYPDTLLIQVLVAATYPLDIIKADRLIATNADLPREERDAAIEAQGWDESVAVLATAFPDVLTGMAEHIDWTESVGLAMLAQSDDVMDAIQALRLTASEAGSLQSNEQQTVEVSQNDAGDETIVIVPSDPEVVYVPQYDHTVVYAEPNTWDVGDVVAASLITYTGIAIIDEIFDDDDPWNDYWRCRNCGGWNGRPIVRNPDIDLDIDGDVNIGNRLDLDWRQDRSRQGEARREISKRRNRDGDTRLELSRPDRGREMREQLSREIGNRDGPRPTPPRRQADRPAIDRDAVIERTRNRERANTGTRPRPQGDRVQRTKPRTPRASQTPRRNTKAKGGSFQRHGGAHRTRAASKRGHKSRNKGGRRR